MNCWGVYSSIMRSEQPNDGQNEENCFKAKGTYELATKNPLIESFKVGKSLQLLMKRLHIHGNNPLDAQESTKRLHELLHDLNILKAACIRQTCLSPKVYRMVCRQYNSSAYGRNENDVVLFSQNGTLDWRIVAGFLKEDLTDGSFSYETASKVLFDISQLVHQALLLLDIDEFQQKYYCKLCWMGNSKIYLDLFNLIQCNDALTAQMSMLLMSSLLERALGDLYLSITAKDQCPSSLKDLLGTEEICHHLGTTAITCLHILVGPPCGLNLRNILWHGFIAPEEFAVEYASLLLLVMCSVSDAPSFEVTDIARQPHVAFRCLDLITSTFLVLSKDDILSFRSLFKESFFIIPTMLPVWERALDYYLLGRYHYTIVLLLPQLEQGLRRVFACVNNCPERIVTAESTVLYTTFEQILSPTLSDGITENRLRQEVGDARLELLLDLLVHIEGPRLRDKISHGEVELLGLPKELASHVICVCAVFAFLYVVIPLGKQQDETEEVFREITTCANNYKSIFHPIAILKRRTRELIESVSTWRDFPKPDSDEFAQLGVYELWELCSIAQNVFQTINSVLFKHAECCSIPDRWGDVLKNVKTLLEKETSTLYCSRLQLEIVGVLRNIVQCCTNVTQQFRDACNTRYKQWLRKELRSRQRSNYRRLWTHMPVMENVLHLMLIVVVIEIVQLSYSELRMQEQNTKRLKFLRRCLTCTENLQSLSGPTKNRWDECAVIGETIIQITLEKLDKLY